jgi:hypothetical protein
MYVSVAQVDLFHKDNKNRKLNTSGADERELEEALKRSLQDMKDKDHFQKYPGGASGNQEDGDDGAPSVGTVLNGGKGGAPAKPAFEAFKGQGVKLGEPEESSSKDAEMADAALYGAYGDDPELAFAIKMSMMEEEAKKMIVQDEPDPSDPSSVSLQLRLPDGSRLQRRFHAEAHTVLDVANFIRKQTNKLQSNVRLSTSGFPRKILEDQGKRLSEYGLTKNEALIVEIK